MTICWRRLIADHSLPMTCWRWLYRLPTSMIAYLALMAQSVCPYKQNATISWSQQHQGMVLCTRFDLFHRIICTSQHSTRLQPDLSDHWRWPSSTAHCRQTYNDPPKDRTGTSSDPKGFWRHTSEILRQESKHLKAPVIIVSTVHNFQAVTGEMAWSFMITCTNCTGRYIQNFHCRTLWSLGHHYQWSRLRLLSITTMTHLRTCWTLRILQIYQSELTPARHGMFPTIWSAELL